ncbi:MAG TPA: saccharopine dehydrogenase NADP-binding domain-containing protein [Agitococcus sp.]|nr:saccharopine dehydrogenase NADP-binding domain-containing protein [Agitococcus sp.]HMY00168.1 saccharopine dehydrogenase NADP-binding domain-containing protein [Agitococcus sp.]HNL80106.1 saccharopine dehydrogenase NADP-binding domain-containing protein [Agitococcus sp.]
MSQYQLVVYGATSFVGQLLTRYLVQTYGVNQQLKWAIAGRSASKLNELKQNLGSGASQLATIIADAQDESALKAMCQQTKVVVSTVGPYALYGSSLVKVCATLGTDYCDLTGEPQWIARMIEQYESAAQASGARIVHCCGFDSIPSDLGTFYLQQQAQQRLGQTCSQVKFRVKAIRGGFSGGTVASMMELFSEISKNPSLRKVMANPYALCPPSNQQKPKQPNLQFAQYDKDAEAWSAPFVMAGINTKVVHRSNALSNYAYGTQFIYDETMLTGKGVIGGAMAVGASVGLAGFVAAAVIPPTRRILQKIVPQAGEGPTPKQQEQGFYDIRLIGLTDNGQRLTAKVTGDRDPGYGSTAKMLGEAAVCLATDISKNDKTGGFWTPSTALGQRLIERLEAKAGLTFKIV